MPVAKHQFLTLYVERIDEMFQHVGRHVTVVHETAHGSYLSLFQFVFHFLHYPAGSLVVYQYVCIAGNLEAIGAVYGVSRKHVARARAYDILHVHDVMLAVMVGQFYETRLLVARDLHHEISGLSAFPVVVFSEKLESHIEPVVAQESTHFILAQRHGLQERIQLLIEMPLYVFPLKRLHILILIEYDAVESQFGHNAIVVYPDAVFHLPVHFGGDLVYHGRSLACRKVIIGPARSHSFQVGHTHLVKLLQI